MASKPTATHKVTAESCEGPNPRMRYVNVCGRKKDGTDGSVRLSRLVMGTDHLGNQWAQQDFPKKKAFLGIDCEKIDKERLKDHAHSMFRSAAAAGINIFDTSPIYVEDIEFTLGSWIRSQENPDLFVLSKGGFPFDDGPGTYRSCFRVKINGNSRIGTHEEIVANLKEEMHGTEEKKGTLDHLSGAMLLFWIMHRDDIRYLDFKPVADVDQSGVIDEKDKKIAALTILEAISDDRLRNYYEWTGVSNWSSERIEEILLAAASRPDLAQPMINSPYFSLFEMDDKNYTIHSGGVQVTHAEMMDENFQKGIIIIPYSPLGGFPIFDSLERDKGEEEITEAKVWERAAEVAAKLDKAGVDEAGDRYWGNVWEAIFTKVNHERFRRVYEASTYFLVNGNDFTVDQWVNAWVLAHPRTDLLAIGPLDKEELNRTVDCFELADVLKHRPDILHWICLGTTDLDGVNKLATCRELETCRELADRF